MPQPRYPRNARLFISDLTTYEAVDDSVVMIEDPPPADRWTIDPVTASLRNELARFTYKPGWTFTIEPPREKAAPMYFAGGNYLPWLKVQMRALDSRGSGRTIPIEFRYVVWETITIDSAASRAQRSEDFRMWLMSTIRDIEDHEMREWFRCDGALVNDPHANARPSPIGPIDR